MKMGYFPMAEIISILSKLPIYKHFINSKGFKRYINLQLIYHTR